MFDIAQSMKEVAEERKETGMIIEKMANENVIINTKIELNVDIGCG